MDTRSKRKKDEDEEDEEEKARGLKFQVHESELNPEDETDANMSTVNKIWVCSFSHDNSKNVSIGKYMNEVSLIKSVYAFWDDRTGNTLDDKLVLMAAAGANRSKKARCL